MEQYKDIIAISSDYYSSKLKEHGETPQGVDWNGIESMRLRAEQLLKVIDKSTHFSINDLGCGWGYIYDLLSELGLDFYYHGFDISEEMVSRANERINNNNKMNYSFASGDKLTNVADYTIASGIFNVKNGFDDEVWIQYIIDILTNMNTLSKKGFAFNCLTSYSDKEHMKPELYYADPLFLFDFCKTNFSRNIALLHDYGLYDFTILVKKEA